MGLAKIVFKYYSALESKRLVRHIGIGLQLFSFKFSAIWVHKGLEISVSKFDE